MSSHPFTKQKLLTILLVIAAACALFFLTFERAHAATNICPDGSTFKVVGYLQTCVDANGAMLTKPDGSTAYSFTTAQVADWAKSNGKTLSDVLQTTKASILQPDSCWATTGTGNLGAFGTCFWRSFMAFFGSIPAYIGVWTVTVAGLLFNWLVEHTIITFSSSVYSGIQSGVEAAWSAFRDVANILIIGIFTFIAISIILGLKEFGQKRLIANVLIVAVLINFSLLFTKIVIDASNFTATQFYKAASLPAPSTDASASEITVGQSQSSSSGISGQFIRFMGITSIGDAYGAVFRFSNAQESGWLAILYGLFVGTLLLAVAAVLFYGSFLLMSRTILLIFLIITAAVAFASYLIPKWESSRYGWDAWWGSLLKCAVFAPILMFFLWATLRIAAAMQVKGGTLGDLVSNPKNSLDMQALFSYLLILGLLFLSFKLSNVFAGKIAGFNYASFLPALAFGGGARLAAMAGRQFIGRPALGISERLQQGSRTTNNAFARRLYDFGAQRFKGVAGRDFNAMRTPFGATLQQAAGLKNLDTLAGKQRKGFEGTQQAFIDRTAKAAGRIEATADEKGKLRERALEEARTETPEMAKEHSEATEMIRSGRSAESTLINAQKDMESKFKQDMSRLSKDLVEAQKSAVASAGDASTANRVREAELAIVKAREAQATAIDQQTQRIKEAKELADRGHAAMRNVTENIKEVAVQTGKMPKSAAEIAEDLVKGDFTARLFRATGISKESNDQLAKKVSAAVGKQQQQKRIKEDIVPALREVMDEGRTPPAAPSAPPVAPAAGGAH
jgi:hypothetical protein